MLMAVRRYRVRPAVDWREDAPHEPISRIRWLRAEAAALISEALAIEQLLPHPREHQPCVTCEECVLRIIADAQRMHCL